MALIFDSHLDLAWNALSWKRDLRQPLAQLNTAEANMDDHLARGRATTSLPEMRRGQVAVCLGTMMGRVPYGTPVQLHGSSLDFPAHENAYAFAHGQLAYYRVLEQQNDLRMISTASQLQQHWQAWQAAEAADQQQLPIGLILAMEGCDPIIAPAQASQWYENGLRCASLVHYGSSAYAVGTGEEGSVTAAGKLLLRQFEEVGIVLDVTHLCDTSFFEALDHYNGPLLASHQNCRAIVDGQRQFSDEQIKAIVQRDGILGLAFDAWMLYPGWQRGKTTAEITPRSVVSIEAAVNHVDHICQLAGNADHVAIGSDLDGGFGTEQTPTGLDSIADLQKLDGLMSSRGYSNDDIRSILGENWLRFFSKVLPAS